jgi:hypothetical protein
MVVMVVLTVVYVVALFAGMDQTGFEIGYCAGILTIVGALQLARRWEKRNGVRTSIAIQEKKRGHS